MAEQKKKMQQLTNSKEVGYKKWLDTCLNIRPTWGLTALAITLVVIMAATIVVWTTDLIKIGLEKNLGLSNNSLAYNIWVKPPIYPLTGIYVFNYTNADAYTKGIDKKLKVEEVGPYTYREMTEKVNVVFNDNGTVSYQLKSSFHFVPEMSAGHQPRHEKIVVPNLPLLSAMSVMKDTYFLTQLAFLTVTRTLDTRQFVELSAHEFFWGYDDPLFSLARTYASFTQELPYKKFGILAAKNGVAKDRITMYTGILNKDKVGVISRFNGQERMNHWNGEECNRIDGTDGTMYPPQMVKKDSRLYIFQGHMCRRFPMEYKKDVIAQGGIPTLRFQPPRDVFANPDINPENACYCHPDSDVCPPSGVFNASPCSFGAPVMISFPHFYLGDPVLLEIVDGLKPDPEKHEIYSDMHAELGVPLDGRSRLQMNMMVRSSPTLKQLTNFKDGSILPFAWFDVGLDELPEEIMSLVYHVTFTTRRVQAALQYILLLLTAVLVYFFVRRVQGLCNSTSTTDSNIVMPI